MYQILDRDLPMGAISFLAAPYLRAAEPSPVELRRALLACLSRRQPTIPKNWSADPVLDDEALEDALASAYPELNLAVGTQADSAFRDPKELRLRAHVRAAVDALNALDRELGALFRLAVHSILIRRGRQTRLDDGAFTNSSPEAIGAIWIDCDRAYSPVTLIELLIGELAQQLLFMEELRDRVLTASQHDREEPPIGTPCDRPINRQVRAVIASTEVVLARLRYGLRGQEREMHPATDILVERIFEAIDEAQVAPELQEAVSPRTIDLLDACKAKLTEARRSPPSLM